MQSDPASAHDELVEKMARAMRELATSERSPYFPKTWEELARAALAVARPVIREECAKVAKSPHHSGCNCFYCYGREHAVDDIRAMIKERENDV